MAERDINGDNVGEWAEKEDFKSGKCILCQKSFQFNYEAKKSKEDKEKKEKERISEEEARQRKRENEEIKQSWVEKREILENQIKACKEFIASQGVIQGKAMERGLVLTKPGDIKAATTRTADFARQATVEKGVVLSELQDKIKHHMSKKPKTGP